MARRPDPKVWLKQLGFDLGKICDSERGRTPMLSASRAGHLHVCQWLFTNGASSTVSTSTSNGWTPMLAACQAGHLDVAEWLFQNGAALDIRKKDATGRTPLRAASFHGHIHVVKWLFASGASADITVVGNSMSPLRAGSAYPDLTLWLILHGAASSRSGHVNNEVLDRDVIPGATPKSLICMRQSLADTVAEHSVFTRLVLQAVCTMPEDQRALRHRSALHKLHGHESGTLALVADYLGIKRGRQLRIIRETLEWFHSVPLPRFSVLQEQKNSNRKSAR